MKNIRGFQRYLPILKWGRDYNKSSLSNDLIAALIVTIMLIPQSLAYALLAGLPAEVGIYASIVPIILYTIFGTSCALAVGPVAVVSLLTASAIGQVAEQGTAGYAVAALTLAFVSGSLLILMGFLRLGFLANFLSHPVIAGFITATGILIATSQLKHILGIKSHGHTMPEMLYSTFKHLGEFNPITVVIGISATVFLFWVRGQFKILNRISNKVFSSGQTLFSKKAISGINREPINWKQAPNISNAKLAAGMSKAEMSYFERLQLQFRNLRHSPLVAEVLTKVGPVVAVFATTLTVWLLGLDNMGVKVVGHVPQSLPPLTMPDFSSGLLGELFIPAVLISVIGFVESVSVAQTLAAKKRQRIDPNQELIGLGAANLGAAFTGGYPVTGGFSRSVVNFDAGAETPAAGAFTAIGLAIAAVGLTPLVYYLPNATLAATIIVAVMSLVDLSILKKTWSYSYTDFTAVLATILLTLGLGVEVGVASGVLISVFLHLYKTSCPHVAEVGLVPGTQHFRNIHRHKVEVDPALVTLRVDESLYFVNARFLEDMIQRRVTEGCAIRNVVFMFSAVNDVDYSALESLEAINRRLKDMGVALHLSEVKGPVLDKLKRSHLLSNLNGHVFLSQHDAWVELCMKDAQKDAVV